jgi:hypothetical protein
VSLQKLRWHRNRGVAYYFGMSLAGARLLARWCPAWRRCEPDLLLLHGTWEGVSGYDRRGLGDDRECPESG